MKTKAWEGFLDSFPEQWQPVINRWNDETILELAIPYKSQRELARNLAQVGGLLDRSVENAEIEVYHAKDRASMLSRLWGEPIFEGGTLILLKTLQFWCSVNPEEHRFDLRGNVSPKSEEAWASLLIGG